MLDKYQSGSSFSGVYNPEADAFVALASEGATFADGRPAPRTVPRRGGHAFAEQALMEKPGTTDRSKNVGFTLTWKGNKTVEINWISGQVNAHNFPEARLTRLAPERVRGPVIRAIEAATGYKVVG